VPSTLRPRTLLVLALSGCASLPAPGAPAPQRVAREPPRASSPPPPAEPGVRVDGDTWFAYGGLNLADRRGTALDASELLDAPAGKHGVLGRQGDGFVFADGTRVRFWGLSIAGQMNLPSEPQAEFIAELCAQLGANLVTHLLPDIELDAERWQRFDLLAARLIGRGVNVALDLEQVGEERVVREWLEHRNPHTGKTYGEDPAVVLLAVRESLRASVRAAGFRGLLGGSDWVRARVTRAERSPSVEAEPGLIHKLVWQRAANAPLLGEWSSAAWVDRNDATVMMAAYAGLHGFSSVMDSLGDRPLIEDQLGCKLENDSSLQCNGGVLALWPALSRLVHRRHVKESGIDGAPPALAYVAKTRGTTENTAIAAENEPLARYVKGTMATSVTGELVADWGKDLFKFDTPRSQGVTGATLGRKESVSNLSVILENPHATVIATSLDDKPLARSTRILISAVGNAANRGATLNASRTAWQDPGTAPVMLEPIVGKIELTGLTGDAANATVHYLSQSGQRVGNVPISTRPGVVQFEMKAEYRTLHYEIVRSRAVP